MDRASRLLRHVYFCLADPAGFGATFAERKRFNDAVFIDPQRRFLFTKNEKCGNTTARRTLQGLYFTEPLPKNFADTKRWTAPMLQPSDLSLARIEDINSRVPFKFAIVRNPYVRLLSCYLAKFGRIGGKNHRFARELGVGMDIPFAEFVRIVSRQKPEEMNPHWRVQYFNIYCDRIHYDEFVKFEDYDAQFGRVLGKFFDRARIESVRKGQFSAGEKMTAHYTPAIAETVRETFKRDFEHFGYSTKLEL